ncbi:dephospho-CoA kinase [Rubripirellula reticaptiva]|uniref:Dephospho-CoA kinase n=1 Tax=Rubripirellula reticaptiva TaxID=2528013 RepID=A0A5C6EBY0_9BACT|nr:dephospho-CoA kinase [Rubripirellula reticaptiva]TWU46398.1 Dephospho-CoA kinase [Rubripirellula reticaptiva]
MIIVGIVGSPAGGKSTVAARLQELGATWINADRIAHSVLEQPDVRRQLIDRWGTGIAGHDGQIDRAKLADLVFRADDPNRTALNYLESLVHPRTRQLIQQELEKAAHAGAPVAILDVPLLFESNWHLACDQIWCIDASFEKRLDRAASRNWDANELRRRETNQLDIHRKKQLSTLVINNYGPLSELIAKVDHNYERLSLAPADNSKHCI